MMKNSLEFRDHLDRIRPLAIEAAKKFHEENPNFNAEWARLLGKSNKGRKPSEEARRNMVLNHADITGKNNPGWKGGKIEVRCECCDKIFKVRRDRFLKGHVRFCSMECHSKLCCGPNHWNWKGGITPYPSGFNEKMKEMVRDIYGRMCVFCKGSEKENCRRLAIHHIDYNKDNNKFDNLLALCQGCNVRVNYDRGFWERLFKEFVKNNRRGLD